jgi:hypothetical protein
MKRRVTLSRVIFALSLVALLAIAVAVADTTKAPSLAASLTAGKLQLKSAGPLAFGTEGVLFVGDSTGGTIAEIDTNDHSASQGSEKIDVKGIDVKIAALVGVAPDQIMINDVKVNPISKNVYLSVSRGRGPDATPLIVRVDAKGEVTNLPLDDIKHASVNLSDAPAANPSARQDPRMMTITNMAYVNGNLMVAGLSNEEWSSALRSIPVPFKTAAEGATLQIWHTSHGRFETASPVRTFVPYTISGQQYILAAYTCTPLVKIPVSDLRPGAKVKGATIADLGSGNQPLDMVPYKKDGHNYILIANTSLGLVKLKADNIESYPHIDSQVNGSAGVPYDKIGDVADVRHVARFDDSQALVLTGKRGSGPAWNPGPSAGPMNLQTISLP